MTEGRQLSELIKEIRQGRVMVVQTKTSVGATETTTWKLQRVRDRS